MYSKGLDPAYPLFEEASADEILDKTDAKFVDVIHTNAGRLEEGRKGFPFSLGHADFWPNGGSIQPVREQFFEFNNLSTVLQIFELKLQRCASSNLKFGKLTTIIKKLAEGLITLNFPL